MTADVLKKKEKCMTFKVTSTLVKKGKLFQSLQSLVFFGITCTDLYRSQLCQLTLRQLTGSTLI